VMHLSEKDGIITTEKGAKFILETLLQSIKEFNKTCPKPGHILNRSHITQSNEYSHVTHSIEYKNHKLTAQIELLKEVKNAKIKPIITTPLRLGSGVEKERVLSISNICLEEN